MDEPAPVATHADPATEQPRDDRIAEIYRLELDRVRLRAIAARHVRDDASEQLGECRRTLAVIDATLARLRTGFDGAPDTRLQSVLNLSDAELEVLWSVTAATTDPALSPHIRELAGGEARQGMSMALHAILAGLDHGLSRTLALRLTGTHPLVRYGLIEFDAGAVPAARTMTVPARVAGYLAGDAALDPSLTGIGGYLEIDQEPHYDDAQLSCVRCIVQGLSMPEPSVVLVSGPRDVGKRTATALAALALRHRVIAIDVAQLADPRSELERAFIAVRRECLLADGLPLIANVDELDDRATRRILARLIAQTPLPVVLTTTSRGYELEVHRPILRAHMPAPDEAARVTLWTRMLEDTPDVDVKILAHRYRIGAGGIRRAVASASLLSTGQLTTRELVRGVRATVTDQLGELAHHVEVKQTWNDLVLTDDTFDQVCALVARVRHARRVLGEWGFSDKLARGQGVAALFSGPPGTGKTMVAGLIANELDLELYQIDLSKVMSKWVGETEKQLARIFDAAEAGHALLLFDEADSLFAKRTEVKSSNDRFANLEVNYLLQRIEAFGGVAILTTNLDTSIDAALRRRLAAHVTFYLPDLEERTALWESMIPGGAPLAQLDFRALADRFCDMTGANIRNAAIAGAFLAASEESAITQRHLERAARGEYRAMGRVI